MNMRPVTISDHNRTVAKVDQADLIPSNKRLMLLQMTNQIPVQDQIQELLIAARTVTVQAHK